MITTPSIQRLGPSYSTELNKDKLPEEGRLVEVGRIRNLPRTQQLVGEHLRRRDGAEEVHTPGRSTRLVHIEQTQRHGRLGNPRSLLAIQLSRRGEAILLDIVDEEVIKRGALRAHFRRIVHERLVGDVVRVDLVLEVRLGIVVAAVDEGFHDVVLPDVVVGALVRVEVEVLLFERLEGEVQRLVVVAEVDVRAREVVLVRDRLVEFGCGFAWASWDEKGPVVESAGGDGGRCCESAGEKGREVHLDRKFCVRIKAKRVRQACKELRGGG